MARQGKKGKNELDVILEQLKRSFGSDSSDLLDGEFLDQEKSEEDEELSEILGKLFSEETDNSVPVKNDEDDVDETAGELIELDTDDIQTVTDDTTVSKTEEDADAVVSEDIEQVDGVLALMLSNGKNGDADSVISAEPVLEAVISEREVVTEEEVIASLEEMAVIATEIVSEIEVFENESVDTDIVENESEAIVNDTSLSNSEIEKKMQ